MIDNLKNNKTVASKFRNWDAAIKPSLYPTGIPIIGSKLIINYFNIGEPSAVLSSDDTSTDTGTDFNLFPLADKLRSLEDNLLLNSPENYYVNRLFKESKGLKKGIKFIYDILNEHLVSSDERRELDFQETGNPFELYITGSIDKDVYRESVAFLSHPLGFVYDYIYISELKFEDNYSLIKYYKINQLEVRCLSGNVEAYNKEVQNIIEKENYLKIIFKDGFYLLQENDTVKYFDNLDYLIKVYPSANHCSIYLDYEILYISTLDDLLKFKEIKDLETDNYPEIYDAISFFENLDFKINYVIGEPIIGEEIITNDTDALEIINLKESTSFNIKPNNLGNPEIYNISAIDEEFFIETF